jgi:2-polyprenyl-3-methyl-5-hydroxy-6-metoxy-1,4-benzoquinol methylase
MLQSAGGVFDIFSIYIGDRLGFFRALAGDGPLTSSELAERTGTHERYVREWLEQATVTGLLRVEDATLAASERRFALPAGHVEPLLERDSLNYIAPLAHLLVSVTRPVDKLLEVYRNGGGLPLSDYGDDFLYGQGTINRAAFLYQLGSEWLPAMPDVHARLLADPPAHVADFGCGVAWSSIGIAQTYPKAQVDGFDLDGPSIAIARANAQEAGVSDRAQFHVRDAGDPAFTGRYDLVVALECLHDMSDPVSALKTMRGLASDGGTVLIVDERVGDEFTPTGNDVEWMMYGWSILHCLPVGMFEQPSSGTGTVMRADTLRRYASEAGFRDVEVLPIDNFFFRFYRLTP